MNTLMERTALISGALALCVFVSWVVSISRDKLKTPDFIALAVSVAAMSCQSTFKDAQFLENDVWLMGGMAYTLTQGACCVAVLLLARGKAMPVSVAGLVLGSFVVYNLVSSVPLAFYGFPVGAMVGAYLLSRHKGQEIDPRTAYLLALVLMLQPLITCPVLIVGYCLAAIKERLPLLADTAVGGHHPPPWQNPSGANTNTFSPTLRQPSQLGTLTTAETDAAKVGRIALALALAGLGAGMAYCLATFASAGWWMRPISDDFLFVPYVDAHGMVGAVSYWYQTWHGRWFSQFVMNLLYSSGYGFIQILPAVLILLWLSSLSCATRTLMGWKWRDCGFIALLILSTTFLATPQTGESIYWAAASLFHTLPLALCGFLVPLLSERNRLRFRLPLCFALGVALGGMSEAFAIFLVLAISVACLWKRSLARAVCLLGISLSLAIVTLAPGNLIRANDTGVNKSVAASAIIEQCWDVSAALFFPNLTNNGPIGFLIMAAAAGLTFLNGSDRPRLKLWLLLAGAVTLRALCFLLLLPAALALGGLYPNRVFITPVFISVIFWAAVGMSVGLCARQWAEARSAKLSMAYAGMAVTLAFSCIWLGEGFRRGESFVEHNQTYASHFADRDRMIRHEMSLGHEVIHVPSYMLYTIPSLQDGERWRAVSLAYHYDKRLKFSIAVVDQTGLSPSAPTKFAEMEWLAPR